MNGSFEGRTIVITGGTGALGRAVVPYFLEAGANCHVTWLDRGELESFPFADHAQLTLHRINCADERAVSEFYQTLPGLWASIHLAGGFQAGPVTDTTLDDLRRMFAVNAITCFLCCREAVRKMRTSVGTSGGRIVNVSARPAVHPAGGMIAYSTSKAAVASMTRCLAEEVKDDGILVNAVLPSIIDTPANRAAMPEADHDRWPKPEQIAQAITCLASPANDLTSGALIPVYGRM